MNKRIAAKIGPLDGAPNPKAEKRRKQQKRYTDKFIAELKLEAKRLGIPFSRLLNKELPTYMSLERPVESRKFVNTPPPKARRATAN